MTIRFLLNGDLTEIDVAHPTQTLLDWLRDMRGLTGTKEGCNEGDCGACSVIVTDEDGARPLNACILFLPQVDGKAVRTVEGIAAPCGSLHPVQEAMITHHGAQCGFCTPGFITTMACNHLNGVTDHDTALAGNLCRCTGYAPIHRAAQAAEAEPVPEHLKADWPVPLGAEHPASARVAPSYAHPENSDALADWYADNPQGTLIAGATDVGLWVTKDFRDLGPVAFLNRCADLKGITETPDGMRIGAMTTLAELEPVMAVRHPSFAQMIRRYGSQQVRAAATLGGNIANGSPIGDSPPALIALGATVHLRHGADRRSMALENFFEAYGQQNRAPGEFVEAVSIPNHSEDLLKCYKISKRFDQDISAVCGCMWIARSEGEITSVRIAFGGMAGIPARAPRAEAALLGKPWAGESFEAAMTALADDFTPLSDMRASAEYRMKTAQNLLWRYWLEASGTAARVRA